jgi:Leucine-rich repeat (LRR) protein
MDYQERNFLNLDRCLIQPYTIDQFLNNETITGISFSHNYLIGIPSFVSDYTNLIELDGSHNELHNSEFLLYRNSTKTDQFNRPLVHPFLEKINLSFNHIKILPLNLHYLRFLHTLDLSFNYLEELPNTIGYLEQLHRLILNDNYLKCLPSTFTRLIQLEYLNLSFNQFQSIDIIKNFFNLKFISLNSNPLKTFPILLDTCLNLEEISLSNIQLNQMKKITFEYFQQFSKLKKLNLSKNNLTNQFLSISNQQMDNLEELYFEYNQFTTIFSLISNLKSLYLLDLSFNSLTNLPECLNSQLKILRLSNNNLELNSNDCIYLKSISELDLDHNQIKEIPNEFLQCLHLQSLNISFNPLKTFPDILLQLRSLNKLRFNSSELQYLPASDLMKKYFHRTLNTLDLSDNNLQTNLSELTVLKALTYLDLSNNQLNELHQDFRLMSCLKVLKLSKNRFLKFPSWLYQMSTDRNHKYIGKNFDRRSFDLLEIRFCR